MLRFPSTSSLSENSRVTRQPFLAPPTEVWCQRVCACKAYVYNYALCTDRLKAGVLPNVPAGKTCAMKPIELTTTMIKCPASHPNIISVSFFPETTV
ncbi:hypothetical protein PRIPAC_83754 [Pristionchus pacificus]|uniref:Uncharacterized protein n=1 Tax=Pristionchus pacificus TaxID=54126 RepID=A0A2A6BXZ0_PRIPA|nr:hypothetical protein PRIPAC_83754 [Pristionchus pacificus]|eukprot:PDM70872.1 hypothetical protein PRIPAC_49070 [Pristionchus pacificus]